MVERPPTRILALLFAAALFAGCTSSEAPEKELPPASPAEEESAPGPRAPVETLVRIVTGGTGIGIDALTVAGETYEHARPGHDVLVQSPVGSSGGIKAVLQQQYDMSISARAPKSTEPGLTFTPIYTDAVVFVVNDEAGVTELSLAQLESIFRGEATNWRQLGGNNLPIRLYSREAEDSITKSYMAAFPTLHNSTWSSVVNILNDDVAMYGILDNTAGAAGFTVRQPMVLREASVVFLAPAGFDASAENLAAGGYPATITVGIVAPIDLVGPAQEYHAWLTGAEGKRVLRNAGFVTV